MGLSVQAHHYIDPAECGPVRQTRQRGDRDRCGSDIANLAGVLEEEMVMLGGIGIEIRAARHDHDLAPVVIGMDYEPATAAITDLLLIASPTKSFSLTYFKNAVFSSGN